MRHSTILKRSAEAETDDGAGVGADGEKLADAQAELEAMKARLEAMESEQRVKDPQATVERGDSGAAPSAEEASREEADARSVYVGNVDYGCTPEELQQHFQGCGTVNRVTILADKFGSPKGFAYIEFLEAEAVSSAALLEGSELRGRQIKVSPKRTNVPGMKMRGRGRGGFAPRGRGGFYGGRGFRGGYGGYGYAPRGRGRGRGYWTPY